MINRTLMILALAGLFQFQALSGTPAPACCVAPPRLPGDQDGVLPVVNADQTVIIIWDAAQKIQHFIRKASFKSEAEDFGFLIPTPSRPELDESGNEAFPFFYEITKPEIITRKVRKDSGGGLGCGCATGKKSAMRTKKAEPLRVLEEKMVAGFKASVLETESTAALVEWLKENGYAYSPEVEAWSRPYVEKGWLITALKVAKDETKKEEKSVSASALRMSFKTEAPLFPYREPDSKLSVEALGATRRLLRIYFLAEARYQGELTKAVPWTGKAVWAGPVPAEKRKKALEILNLPEDTGAAEWWLTEFEDPWPYRVHPADVYFSKAQNQDLLKRPPVIQYVASGSTPGVTLFALAGVVVLLPIYRWRRRSMQDQRIEAEAS